MRLLKKDYSRDLAGHSLENEQTHELNRIFFRCKAKFCENPDAKNSKCHNDTS